MANNRTLLEKKRTLEDKKAGLESLKRSLSAGMTNLLKISRESPESDPYLGITYCEESEALAKVEKMIVETETELDEVLGKIAFNGGVTDNTPAVRAVKTPTKKSNETEDEAFDEILGKLQAITNELDLAESDDDDAENLKALLDVVNGCIECSKLIGEYIEAIDAITGSVKDANTRNKGEKR